MRKAQSLRYTSATPRIAVRGNSDFGYISQLPRELRDEIMLRIPYPQLTRLCQEAPELCPPSMWTKRAGSKAENLSQYLEVTQKAKWDAIVGPEEIRTINVWGPKTGLDIARWDSLPDAIMLRDRELVEYALSTIEDPTHHLINALYRVTRRDPDTICWLVEQGFRLGNYGKPISAVIGELAWGPPSNIKVLECLASIMKLPWDKIFIKYAHVPWLKEYVAQYVPRQ